jgi:hypothetical protein
MVLLKRVWPVLLLALILAGIIALTIKPYNWNITSLFHMDEVTSAPRPVPAGFVVMQVPSYDGAQYYQVARNIPLMISPPDWSGVVQKGPGSYAYQRFLLPLTAFILSAGNLAMLPYAFVWINILALLLTCLVVLHWTRKPLYALAVTLCPAAMVALHFTLAEPLTLLLISLFLVRYQSKQRIDTVSMILLSFVVLAREVNVLFVLFLIGYSLLRLRWRDVLLLLVPVASFVALHGLIYGIFGNIPFFVSTGAHNWPGASAMKLVLGTRGYNQYTLSAIALFMAFVIPAIIWILGTMFKEKRFDVLTLGSLAFFCLMLIMPDYIWGSMTSIGRVITPVYPLFLFAAAERDTWIARGLAVIVLILGLATAIGLALSVHPYLISR